MATAPEITKGWYFAKDELRANSPSKKDGLPFAQEVKYQRSTCAFMQDAGVKLKMPQLSIATAIVFFHRFFSVHSYVKHDRHIIGSACLFLAGKVEETPKKTT